MYLHYFGIPYAFNGGVTPPGCPAGAKNGEDDVLAPGYYTLETKLFTSRYHAKFGRFSRREITRDTGVTTRRSADGGQKFRF